MAPRGRPTRLNPGTTPPPVTDPTTTTSVTSAQLQAMIDEGVTAVLAARATTRNGDDSHTSGTGVRRNERAVRECTYQDFMKCQPLFFRGTEGVVDLTQWFERMETVFRISNCTVENQVKFATCTLMGIALTWWNSHARTVTNEVAYAMTWSDLKKKMTTKYCPRNEIKKIEAELWNLKVKGTDVVAYNQRFQELALLCDRMFPEETDKIERYVGGMPDLIYSSVVASKPKTMQEAIEMATELIDRRNNTFAERQAENKRKFEDTPRNNQNQQPNKRQNTGRAYAAGNGDKKSYEGTKPLCPKPLQEGLPLVEEQEPGKWQRCSQGICSGSCRAKPRQQCCDGPEVCAQGCQRLFGHIYRQGRMGQVEDEANWKKGVREETSQRLLQIDLDIRIHKYAVGFVNAPDVFFMEIMNPRQARAWKGASVDNTELLKERGVIQPDRIVKIGHLPKTPTEIRQFLGLAGYYRIHEGFSKIANHDEVTQKRSSWVGCENQETAFKY
ncbi:reverse transcriptase domain-containing protein [Tanacetum coccineum]